MSITLDLSMEIVEQLKRLSETTSQTIEEIVARGIETQLSPAPESERHGLKKLMGYAGCIDSGASNSGDNGKIDQDLAGAYADHSHPFNRYIPALLHSRY